MQQKKNAPEDDLIINAAKAEIERLNKAYPGREFHLFTEKGFGIRLKMFGWVGKENEAN
ncbi:hypothetical protein KHA80_00600 [Anaerobacillus sp. HL2]|nr:hypothetical protein KHA80_00600 [Anaerobacillus sp. HL2]